MELECNSLKSVLAFNTEKHLENIKNNVFINELNIGTATVSSPKIVKDRSIYGQPKISLTDNSYQLNNKTTSTWRSLDSLSAPDSGTSLHSASASASTSTSDLRSRFETNASDLGTSVETSEDEADTYRRHARCNSSLSSSQISTGSDVFDNDGHCDVLLVDSAENSSRIFMRNFVKNIFRNCSEISLEEKAIFGEFSRSLTGRLWFARYINEQRNENKLVNESTFYSLAQYFALILFECCEADDYTPARILMNMCFTYYLQTSKTLPQPPSLLSSSSSSSSSSTFSALSITKAFRQNRNCSLKSFFPSKLSVSSQSKESLQQCPNSAETTTISESYYLANILRDQPIWKSARFWNAAFFDAIQDEREKYFFNKHHHNDSNTNDNISNDSTTSQTKFSRQSSYDDWQFQANVTFGALATFTHNMHSFGLSKCFCLQFLQKQSTIANLTQEQIHLIRDNIDRLYSG